MKKLSFSIVLLLLAFFTKWLLWDLNISSGKMVGTISQISQKGKIPFLKSWEGVLNDDKGPSTFSVRDNRIGLELLKTEGIPVILYFNQSLISWPRDTDISVTSWRPVQNKEDPSPNESKIFSMFEKSLFCSFLGSLLNNKELYNQVKEYIKAQNIFLFNQYQKCNK